VGQQPSDLGTPFTCSDHLSVTDSSDAASAEFLSRTGYHRSLSDRHSLSLCELTNKALRIVFRITSRFQPQSRVGRGTSPTISRFERVGGAPVVGPPYRLISTTETFGKLFPTHSLAARESAQCAAADVTCSVHVDLLPSG
jgi:hypothetical protein